LPARDSIIFKLVFLIPGFSTPESRLGRCAVTPRSYCSPKFEGVLAPQKPRKPSLRDVCLVSLAMRMKCKEVFAPFAR